MSNHIDLTVDDLQDSNSYPDAVRYAKRPRMEPMSPWLTQQSSSLTFQASSPISTVYTPLPINPLLPSGSITQPVATSRFGFRPAPSRPLLPGVSFQSQQSTPSTSPGGLLYHNQLPTQSSPSSCPPERDIIDLTSSPSPPPPRYPPSQTCQPHLPPELPPKTPVCIGQFAATALILYPDQYTIPQTTSDPEWVPVRLQYEHDPNKTAGRETIHIKSPSGRGMNGETVAGDRFGMIEHKIADSIGPMLAKGLIRLESKIRKGSGVSLPRLLSFQNQRRLSRFPFYHFKCLSIHRRGISLLWASI